jgi:hypothetical protein
MSKRWIVEGIFTESLQLRVTDGHGLLFDDSVAYLLGSEFLLRLKLIGQKCFVNTNCTMRCVIILKTCVQTLVTKGFVAMAVAGQLSKRSWNILSDLI